MGSQVRYYISGLYRELWEKPFFLWAQAIAFKVLIALVPVILLATGVLGLILREERPFSYVERVIREVVPEFGADELVAFLSTLQSQSQTFTIIGLIGLVLTSVTLFTTLRVVLGQIFKEEWHEHRPIFQGYVFDFQMAIQTGVLFLSSIAVSVVMSSGGAAGLRRIGMSGTWLSELWTSVAQVSLFVLPLLLSIAMFYQLYWFIPKPRPPKMAALAGAVSAAFMFEAGKAMVTMFAGRFGVTNGWQSMLGDTYLLIILVVLWAYYSGLILSLGACVALLAERRRRLVVTDPAPELVVESASTEVITARPDL